MSIRWTCLLVLEFQRFPDCQALPQQPLWSLHPTCNPLWPCRIIWSKWYATSVEWLGFIILHHNRMSHFSDPTQFWYVMHWKIIGSWVSKYAQTSPSKIYFHVYPSGNKVIKEFTPNGFVSYDKSGDLFNLQKYKLTDMMAKKIKITWEDPEEPSKKSGNYSVWCW